MDTSNILSAFEVEIEIEGTRFDKTESTHNLSNILRDKVRRVNQNAKVVMDGDTFIVYGLPQKDLENVLAKISNVSDTVHSQPFSYQVTPRQLSAGEVINLLYPYLTGLEARVTAQSDKLKGLEHVAASMDEARKQAEMSAKQAEKSLRSAVDELKRQEAEVSRLKAARQSPAVVAQPQTRHVQSMSHMHLIDALKSPANFIRAIDIQLRQYESSGRDFTAKPNAFPSLENYLGKEFDLTVDTVNDALIKLARRYSTGWLQSATAGKRAMREVINTTKKYEKLAAQHAQLLNYKEVGVIIPVAVVRDGDAVHYYVPRGSSTGLSQSLRDSFVAIVEKCGFQASTEQKEYTNNITVRGTDVAEQIKSNFDHLSVPLWQNLGVKIQFIVD